MYGNILFFLLFLLVYTLYQPLEQPPFPWLPALGLNLALLVAFGWWTRSLTGRLARRVREGFAGSVSYLFMRVQRRLAMMSLLFFGAAVYVLGLKELIVALPLAGRLEAVTGAVGLVVFCLYLALMWSAIYSLYKEVYRSRVSRIQYVWSQIRFNFFVVIPWLFFSVLVDLENLLPASGFKTWLESQGGQITIITLFLSVLAVLFPLIIRPLWGLTPLPDNHYRAVIEAFCREHGFKYREIMIWPLNQGEALTAGVMGFIGPLRYILITPALLRILDDEELRAVMAHELGHVRYRHMLWYFIFFLGFVILTMTLTDINQALLLLIPSVRDLMVSAGDRPNTILALLVHAPIIILTVLFVRFVLGFYMRGFERQADLHAFQLTGSASGIVNSLEKIARFAGQSRDLPSWHHYSVAQRIDFIDQCALNPETGRRHHRKVKWMTVVYMTVLLAGGLAAYRYQTPEVQAKVNLLYLESLERRHPRDVVLQVTLGNYYAQSDENEKAVAAYDKALALDPQDPRLLNNAVFLNNFAWSLVTQKAPTDEDKARALPLAERAAQLEDEPYILDTLAEVLFANGRRDDAIQTIDQALGKVPPSSDLYDHLTRQRRKFTGDH